MSAESELMADIRSAPCEDFRQSARDMRATAAHLIAEGWTKPRTVTTAAELDALPVGSVVLDDEGDAWQNRGYADLNWCSTTYGRNFGMNAANLLDRFGPATVLHEPGEGQ